jgi:predicted nuclease with TOPRIM domain
MSLKQVVKQRKAYVKNKLKGVAKEKSEKVMEILENNHPINELIEEIEKLDVFKARDLSDIKKHFEQIDRSDRLGR